MKYAIIELQGKQHKVVPGGQLLIDRLTGEVGEIINLDKVLLTVDEQGVQVGAPFLKEVSLQAKLLGHERGEKIRVATYKAKSRYRKVKGHRQDLTRIEINANSSVIQAATASKKTKVNRKTTV